MIILSGLIPSAQLSSHFCSHIPGDKNLILLVNGFLSAIRLLVVVPTAANHCDTHCGCS